MGAVDSLVLAKVMSLIGVSLSVGLRQSPETPVGMGHSEVADILAGQATRRLAFEFRVDVTLPNIHGLHQVHVAVEDFKTISCHNCLQSGLNLFCYRSTTLDLTLSINTRTIAHHLFR